jgi:hypothetical protein
VHVLARQGNLTALQHLQGYRPQLLSARSPEGLTPFLSACASGQTRVAAWLVIMGYAKVDENELNIGATGFHLAAVRNQVQTLKWLLETRPDLVDIRTNDHATPLRIAAEAGFHSIVEMLLSYGASPTLADDHGVTPAHVAHVYGHHNVYDMLARAALARIVQEPDGVSGKRRGEESCVVLFLCWLVWFGVPGRPSIFQLQPLCDTPPPPTTQPLLRSQNPNRKRPTRAPPWSLPYGNIECPSRTWSR